MCVVCVCVCVCVCVVCVCCVQMQRREKLINHAFFSKYGDEFDAKFPPIKGDEVLTHCT